MASTKIPVAIRIDPEIREMACRAAKEEHRTFTSYVEWLVLEDAKKRGPQPQRIKRSANERVV